MLNQPTSREARTVLLIEQEVEGTSVELGATMVKEQGGGIAVHAADPEREALYGLMKGVLCKVHKYIQAPGNSPRCPDVGLTVL